MRKQIFLATVIILLTITVFSSFCGLERASADTDGYFIICNPDSYLNVRKTPKKGSEETGRLYCGDRVQTDGKTKNGYLHCINLSTEYGEGWVHIGYLVKDQPQIITGYATVSAGGRVAARRWINGKRSSWIRDGTRLRVIVVSDEWTLTIRGFVKTEFLEVDR